MLSGSRTPGSEVPKTTLRDTSSDVACASLVNKAGQRLFPTAPKVGERTVNPLAFERRCLVRFQGREPKYMVLAFNPRQLNRPEFRVEPTTYCGVEK